jgi:ubiquinone/menaquinone biosynthesis C-methylase UbiE
METQQIPPELESLKSRLRDTWVAGDYGQIAQSTMAGAEEFVGRLGLKPGMRVLDVACGTGNLSIAAARTGADVTGVDIAPNLVEQAIARAEAENVTAKFDVGDAEAIPYEDARFDVVMTMFGSMFAPRPEVVAAEHKRVCKPGGVIAMANWTPDGFAGQVFRVIGKHVPPPPGVPPVLWGEEETVRQRFSEGISELRLTRRMVEITYPFGPADVVEHFRRFFGPTVKAFESLDTGGQEALRRDLERLWTESNGADDNTTRVNGEYLEVTAVRE